MTLEMDSMNWVGEPSVGINYVIESFVVFSLFSDVNVIELHPVTYRTGCKF